MIRYFVTNRIKLFTSGVTCACKSLFSFSRFTSVRFTVFYFISPKRLIMKSKIIPSLFGFILFAPSVSAQRTEFTNEFGMQFVLIKPGSFVLGKFQPTVGKPEPGRKTLPVKMYEKAKEMAKKDALPGFTVKIKQPFYIGKFEV